MSECVSRIVTTRLYRRLMRPLLRSLITVAGLLLVAGYLMGAMTASRSDQVVAWSYINFFLPIPALLYCFLILLPAEIAVGTYVPRAVTVITSPLVGWLVAFMALLAMMTSPNARGAGGQYIQALGAITGLLWELSYLLLPAKGVPGSTRV